MAPRLSQILTHPYGQHANIAVRARACAWPGRRHARHDTGLEALSVLPPAGTAIAQEVNR